jgi:hypothetical protein
MSVFPAYAQRTPGRVTGSDTARHESFRRPLEPRW